jgi:hypothetical protein
MKFPKNAWTIIVSFADERAPQVDTLKAPEHDFGRLPLNRLRTSLRRFAATSSLRRIASVDQQTRSGN